MSKPAERAVAADRVFDGTTVHRDAAVVVEDDRIAGIVPRAELPKTIAVRVLPDGAWLAPGFIDLQVNGGGDVLFNDEPTPEGIRVIAAAHRKFGTTALLPTFITDASDKTKAAVDAVRSLVGRDPSVLGVHLEGPFLSPERPGVHDPRFIRRPAAGDIEWLASTGAGAVLISLAPEQVPTGFIAQLVRRGVRVSLAHSMATYEQTRSAMAEGLSGFTHLFNAMPPILGRQPGPIAAALESHDAWYGLIVDGIHVDPAALRLALRGVGHPMLVTDAMPPVGGRRSTFRLYGEEIVVTDGRCARKDGTLAGAALTMVQAVGNCVRLLGLALPDALRLASAEPADFVGLGDRLGRLARGFRADMVAFDPTSFEVLDTWVAGR